MTRPRRALVVASPYSEGAARALIAGAASRGALAAEILPRTRLVALAASLPLPSAAARTTFGRRMRVLRDGYAASRPHRVERVSHLAEMVLRAGLRLPCPGLALRASYLSKVLFDRAAAAVELPEGAVVLGFPGACLALFRAHPDARRVLHAVDAHPRAHNGELLRHFSRRRTWDERYPGRLVRRIEKELRLADIVLTPSALVSEQMARYGVDRAKIVQIPYGVSLTGFTPDGPSVDRDPERRRLVCAAHLSHRKGIPQLLDAVRGLPVDLVLAGGVFDRRLLRGAPPNVIVTGPLSAEELAREFRAADAFVLPTLEDACSLVVAEAAASGLPVITTDANGASALLDPLHSTVLPAGDVRGLRDVLGRVQPLDRATRLAIADSARAAATSITDWTTYAERVLDVVLAEEGRQGTDARAGSGPRRERN
ncbi:glycosyltransferase involved in cell wall biosynthesis [Rathayibacter sp. PhB152]|uniref:glycosyltransferase family 4 protein n=1 Tax=Rathayibacter sp. PhB152 TaxID=2485190 RepID=UPI000F4B3579|nr:glycosyltransferase family 4 protein [Rathayibacter sp. PhB152]ROQ63883.1 glycosyltransferase involved in cell wall biosynthesis [Rathayibacter sp. PhB152]